MKNQSLVTVYITTFNRVNLLARAIDSVEGQTYKNIELIVVDDCSNDATFQFMKSRSNKLPTTYIRNEVNSGAPASRNKAIALAAGEYITGLDDDDYFLPERVECFVKKMCQIDNARAILFSDYVIIDQQRRHRIIQGPKTVTFSKLLSGNFIGNQVFIRTEMMRSIDGFLVNLPAWQDFECWLRLLREYGCALNVPSATYVVDQSHSFERITSGKLERIERACEMVALFHANTNRERLSLQLSLLGYPGIPFTFVHFFKFLLNGLCFAPFKLYIFKAIGRC